MRPQRPSPRSALAWLAPGHQLLLRRRGASRSGAASLDLGRQRWALRCIHDLVREDARQASVALVAHVESVVGKHGAEPCIRRVGPLLHELIPSEHRCMVALSDLPDDVDEALIALLL